MSFYSNEMIISLYFKDEPPRAQVMAEIENLMILVDQFEALADNLALSIFNTDCASSLRIDDDEADDVRFVDGDGDFPMSIHISSQKLVQEAIIEQVKNLVVKQLDTIRQSISVTLVLSFQYEGWKIDS